MDNTEQREVDVDFSGDGEGQIPDSQLVKRFPVTELGAGEIEVEKAA